ncbi:MAG: 2-enoyl thioester reductase domain-containing protein [Luteolibacter sp.]|jgi:NADPH:quinone reductase-like Zn-dependent oxidoreductase|nr:2-enoyl thioester reductase domain-containing protein [Luteolibacter sp.]
MSSEAPISPGTQLVFRQTGKPAEVLETQTFTPRAPMAGEVLIRILAAPINPADLNTIEGTYGVKLDLPATPGVEGCGIVEASDDGGYQAGDRVIFLRRADTWATHTTVSADTLFKLPEDIDPRQAAMLKVNPATAWQLLQGIEALPGGAAIVQNAGNSAVGRCVIQLARDLGIRTVSFVRRAELFDELRALGADEVFLDDDDGLAAAKSALGGAKAALAFNAVGGESALRLMKLLREGGTHITYGAMGRKPLTVPNGLLIFRDIRVRGLWVTRWVENAPIAEIRAIYQNLAARVAAGTLVQPVDGTFPLEAFRDALARLDAPERGGKVLFTP